jgi:hypothetical protein
VFASTSTLSCISAGTITTTNHSLGQHGGITSTTADDSVSGWVEELVE